MSNSTQNRRQFIATSGKAGMALAAMPLMAKISSPTILTAANEFAQQPLNYGYAALEPFIDAMTMEIHYTKHAATYAKNLADAAIAEKLDTTQTSLPQLLNTISSYSVKMRNNAGGHFNHEMFWQMMKPAPATLPTGELAEAIKPEMFSNDLFEYVPVATLQRLGYILEKVLEYDYLADTLYEIFEQRSITLFRTPLKASSPEVGFPLDERWKIIENTEIEIDE